MDWSRRSLINHSWSLSNSHEICNLRDYGANEFPWILMAAPEVYHFRAWPEILNLCREISSGPNYFLLPRCCLEVFLFSLWLTLLAQSLLCYYIWRILFKKKTISQCILYLLPHILCCILSSILKNSIQILWKIWLETVCSVMLLTQDSDAAGYIWKGKSRFFFLLLRLLWMNSQPKIPHKFLFNLYSNISDNVSFP